MMDDHGREDGPDGPHVLFTAEARDAVESLAVLRRYAQEKLAGLDVDRLTPTQARALRQYQEAPPRPRDFRAGIPLAYERLTQLAEVLEDEAFLQRIAWSLDGVTQWLQQIYAHQQGERS